MTDNNKNKVRKSIYIDSEAWAKLDNFITGSKSEFIEKQIIKQITLNDDIESLKLKREHLTLKKNEIEKEINEINNQIKYIADIRANNRNDKDLINRAMDTIKRIIDNEGAITKDRIKYIANNHVLNYSILCAECEKQNYKILD